MLRHLRNFSGLLLLGAVLCSTPAQAQGAVPTTGGAAPAASRTATTALGAAATSAAPTVESYAALRAWLGLAKERAPEVSVAKASLSSSRSALVNGKLAPLGNPYLELTAERGGKGVTKDVAINGTLWLPLELSGQRASRGKEARDFVALHAAYVEQARAHAAARVVRAYGATVVALERAAVLTELLSSARAEALLISERVKSGDAIARDASLAAVEAARHEVMLAETQAELLRSKGELSELLGTEAADVPIVPPPPLQGGLRGLKLPSTPQSQSLTAEARFYSSSAERLRREGQSPLSLALVAGRGDLGEARLGGGLAYAFPAFRSNQAERARAQAESTRALAEKGVYEAMIARRLRLLEQEQAQLALALEMLTAQALPAAQSAVSAVQETYAAGKAELLAVLLSRRELSSLSLRRLELLQANWILVSEFVEVTGELP